MLTAFAPASYLQTSGTSIINKYFTKALLNKLEDSDFLFKHATCISFGVDYTLKGDSYTCTKLVLQTKKLVVGDGIEFENEWIYDK